MAEVMTAFDRSTTWPGWRESVAPGSVKSYCIFEDINNVPSLRKLKELPAKDIQHNLKIIRKCQTTQSLSAHWGVGPELVHKLFNLFKVEAPSDK